RYDWNNFDEKRAFGASVSLYEKNPLTGVNAGEPVADVWGVVGRNNNGGFTLPSVLVESNEAVQTPDK
ncbi:hypothetical protein GCK32_022171, partial [Trichostrongylus colubriformis]